MQQLYDWSLRIVSEEYLGGREAMAKASEERYRLIFDDSPLAIWIWDTDTRGIVEVNDAALRIYGYTRE